MSDGSSHKADACSFGIYSSILKVQILVDYDNVSDALTRNGPRYVADHIQSELLSKRKSTFQGDVRLDFRFYGGWQMQTRRSPRALQLITAIQKDFPAIIFDRTLNRRVTLNASLAESLLALPHQILPHTFREYSEPPKLKCKTPQALGCIQIDCMAAEVHSLFTNRQCPEISCRRPISEILSRSEQKLVDTMLVADIVYLSQSGESAIGVVSSDDDLWPGMLSAMKAGTEVIHLTTKYSSTARLYLGSVRTRYSTLAL
jgi:hypothetical protein